MADIADDGIVLHLAHVFQAQHVLVARAGDEDVAVRGDFLDRAHFVTFHRRLQGADRVDFGDDDAGAAITQRGGRTLADVAIAQDDRDLAGQHDVSGAADGVDQAFTAAIEVVELRLGDAVIDVDRRERQVTLLRHGVEAVHAGRRFFRHTLDRVADGRIEARLFLEVALHDGIQRFFFLIGRMIEKRRVLFGLGAQHAEQGGVAAVVEDQVGVTAIMPFEDLVGVVPVFRQGFALDGKHRRAALGNRRGGVILGREDIARRPAHFGAQGLQGFDQHARLDGHVQRAGDARALQRLVLAEFLARRHQAGHFALGDFQFLAAPGGKRQVFDDKVLCGGHRTVPFEMNDRAYNAR